MENKINIAELLKDCPQGMELDCTMFENPVKYMGLTNGGTYIKIKTSYDKVFYLTKEGYMFNMADSKCVIFPKGKATWEGFVPPCKFKDGDVISDSLGTCIFKGEGVIQGTVDYYCGVHGDYFIVKENTDGHYGDIVDYRLATEEEKQKLFDAIKENGYRWNAETKTLENMTVPHTPEKLYIRIGEIPINEKSSVHRGDAVVGYEDGVSVYDCVEIDGLYQIVMPFPLKEGQGMTYECLIQEITQCRYEIEKPRNVYLVSGREVGKGHDNEPLIKDVRILKVLTGQFNTKNDNNKETKTLEKVEPIFKAGDVVANQNNIGTWIGIYHKHDCLNETFSSYCYIRRDGIFCTNSNTGHGYYKTRLATEEEKQKLFDAIKANGYKWNPETKVLEKLVKPIFKAGDRIAEKNGIRKPFTISQVGDCYYSANEQNAVRIMSIEDQDNYELVPDKFDISTLKPFDYVLVRLTTNCIWMPKFFSHYDTNPKIKHYPFVTTDNIGYPQCIPYNGNEHLCRKADKCDEYYKNW